MLRLVGCQRPLRQDLHREEVAYGLEAYYGVGALQHELADVGGVRPDGRLHDAWRPAWRVVQVSVPHGVLPDVADQVLGSAGAPRHGHDCDVARWQPATGTSRADMPDD